MEEDIFLAGDGVVAVAAVEPGSVTDIETEDEAGIMESLGL